MPEYWVMCYERGIAEQRPARTIEAKDELEAVRKVVGEEPLQAEGKLEQLRAEVWRLSEDSRKTPFYTPPLVVSDSTENTL